MKKIRWRRAANNDVQSISDYYIQEESPDAAKRFLDALVLVTDRISRQPAAGSPRYSHKLNVPGLRFCLVPRFPYLVFYKATPEGVDIWRIFHAQRDFLASLGDSDEEEN
jgi:toxin ParE1/3/4